MALRICYLCVRAYSSLNIRVVVVSSVRQLIMVEMCLKVNSAWQLGNMDYVPYGIN